MKNNKTIFKTINQLIKSGSHFGHKTKYWNPYMKSYIFGKFQNIHIINLKKTIYYLDKAVLILKDSLLNKDEILFVGTKPGINNLVSNLAISLNQFYVNYRWLGGMLTNWYTMKKLMNKLSELEMQFKIGYLNNLPKKQKKIKIKEMMNLKLLLKGILDMKKIPKLLFVIDANYEHIAINEAKKLNIKICAILDTDSNPKNIDYIIPANDDSIKSIDFCLTYLKNKIL